MPSHINVTQFDITPNKRKRINSFINQHEVRLASRGSTIQATNNATGNKENKFNFMLGMEEKSLAEMVVNKTIDNPFEVIRKPPKKKKKNDFEESSCFTNAALNINGPEKVVNPFEIVRSPIAPLKTPTHCFINSGLNIRGPEKEVCNPFEIVRNAPESFAPAAAVPTESASGIENPALDVSLSKSKPTTRAISVPFTPTSNCRINFNDIPLESLTPCSMLASKLVFSPIAGTVQETPKKSNPLKVTSELSVISEEAIDIAEELDCYQLELENSINEAKSDKKKVGGWKRTKNLMDMKNKEKFSNRLNKLFTDGEADDAVEKDKADEPKNSESVEPVKNESLSFTEMLNECIDEHTKPKDVAYEQCKTDNSSEDDEFQFKNPQPFVRTFRRKSTRLKAATSTELSSNSSSTKSLNEQEKPSNNFRSSIRKSIRKLMTSSNSEKSIPENDQHSTNLFSSLRQSLRRKKPAQKSSAEEELLQHHDLSILIDDDRKVFKQIKTNRDEETVDLMQAKRSIRSSFRNTTKDVRRQVMKSVFKRNVEDYCLD